MSASWIADISFYLSPVDESLVGLSTFLADENIHQGGHFPSMDACEIALIGISYASDHPYFGADEKVRQQLYQLQPIGALKIVDLGNILAGSSETDLHHAIKAISAALIEKDIIPICLSGSQEVTYSFYSAFEELGRVVNLAIVDSKIDLGEFREELNPTNYLSKIVLNDPGFLFNLSVLGYQSYFNSAELTDLMDKLFFDVCRLGAVNADIKLVEPHIRNADVVSIDLNAVRGSDAPATAQPNGFSGEYICQISRYAGLSEKTSVFGVFNFNPDRDRHNQTALLLAQIFWYFCEGFSQRQKEFPHLSTKNFMTFQVHLDDGRNEMLFYKSKRTNKWWINVPYSGRDAERLKRHHIVPCSQADYELARSGEVPDVWWKTYQKIG